MHLSTVKVPIDFGIDWPCFIFILKPVFFYQIVRPLFICIGLYIFSETIASECSTFHRALHIRILICMWIGSRLRPRNSLVLYLGGTMGAQWAIDLAIGTGFYKLLSVFARFYSIHVLGWLQKWLNLITAPGSVSNKPSSVTWLATKYLKTVSWRNHTEKLTTWWPQNISFWPKINIPSSCLT